MKFRVDHNVEAGVIVCRITGRIVLLDVHEILQGIMDCSRRNDARKLFLDLRESENGMEISDLVEVSIIGERIGFDESWKIAIIVDVVEVKHRFYEKFSSNRNRSLKIFTEGDIAMDWLTGGS
jgi:hypothetical protein